MRLAILIGSGASIPAKMPDVDKITEGIFANGPVARHTDGNYLWGIDLPGWSPTEEHVPRARAFTKCVIDKINEYFQAMEFPPRKANYEDLYEALDFMAGYEQSNPDCVFIRPMISEIKETVDKICVSQKIDCKPQWKLWDLATEGDKFISAGVSHQLWKKPERLDYLDPLFRVIQNRRINRVELFTLNHDILFETYMLRNDIPYNDGFNSPGPGYGFWIPGLINTADPRIAIFKLHGSINWYMNDSKDFNKRVVIVRDGTIFWENPVNYPLPFDLRQNQLIIIGNSIKLRAYLTPFYSQLQDAFTSGLNQARRLLVIGYGFRDYGVNLKVSNWLHKGSDHKLIVIDPNCRNIPELQGLHPDKVALFPEFLEDIKTQVLSDAVLQ